jgi:MarR family 2-MHQ and catechol resistance regulon transcriptional repressor
MTGATGDDSSAVHLWVVLWRASRSVAGHAERHIAELGLCGSDFGVLEALLHKGPLTVGQLGTKVLLTSGSMTTAVDRLEVRRLVERRDSADDRRARVVHLTREGRGFIERAFADHRAALERAVSPLTPAERRTVVRLLRKLGLGSQALLAGETPRERRRPTRHGRNDG